MSFGSRKHRQPLLFGDKDFLSFIYTYHKLKLAKQSPSEILKKLAEQILVPISIFVLGLGCLEAIVKYLHENLDLGFEEIAKLLNRSEANCRISYSNSCQKHMQRFETLNFLDDKKAIFVPIRIFSDTKLGMQECLVMFLKEELHLKFSEISQLIHRNQRTIWTSYHRATSKMLKGSKESSGQLGKDTAHKGRKNEE